MGFALTDPDCEYGSRDPVDPQHWSEPDTIYMTNFFRLKSENANNIY